MILPGSSPSDALAIAETIRSASQNLHIPHSASAVGVVTLSIGVGTADGDQDAKSLINLTDQALYSAKAKGRNRICVMTAAFTDSPRSFNGYGNSDQGCATERHFKPSRSRSARAVEMAAPEARNL